MLFPALLGYSWRAEIEYIAWFLDIQIQWGIFAITHLVNGVATQRSYQAGLILWWDCPQSTTALAYFMCTKAHQLQSFIMRNTESLECTWLLSPNFIHFPHHLPFPSLLLTLGRCVCPTVLDSHVHEMGHAAFASLWTFATLMTFYFRLLVLWSSSVSTHHLCCDWVGSVHTSGKLFGLTPIAVIRNSVWVHSRTLYFSKCPS